MFSQNNFFNPEPILKKNGLFVFYDLRLGALCSSEEGLEETHNHMSHD